MALPLGFEPTTGDGLRALMATPVACDGFEEVVAVERQQPRLASGADRGGAGHVPKQGDLPETLALALGALEDIVHDHLDLPAVDQIEAVSGLALSDHLLPRLGIDRDQRAAYAFEGVNGKGAKIEVPRRRL